MTTLVLYGYHAKPTCNLTFFGRNARKARPKCSSQEICPPRAFLRCKGNFHAAVLRDHGTRIGGCLGPPKLADGKHDQNRLAVMKASRSLTTYVEKLRKKKDPKKRPTSKIRSFLEVLPEKWQPMTEDWTTETNWLVSLCPWLAGPSDPSYRPTSTPTRWYSAQRLRWQTQGLRGKSHAARSPIETPLHYSLVAWPIKHDLFPLTIYIIFTHYLYNILIRSYPLKQNHAGTRLHASFATFFGGSASGVHPDGYPSFGDS